MRALIKRSEVETVAAPGLDEAPAAGRRPGEALAVATMEPAEALAAGLGPAEALADATMEPGAALAAAGALVPMEVRTLGPVDGAAPGLTAALTGLRQARAILSGRPRRGGETLRGRWYPHTAALVVAVAEMLARCPGRFQHLPVRAEGLREELRRVGELETARAAAAELLSELDGELAARKGRLSEAAALCLRSVRAQLADPLAEVSELRAAAARALGIVERWSAGRTQARRRSAARVAASEASAES